MAESEYRYIHKFTKTLYSLLSFAHFYSAPVHRHPFDIQLHFHTIHSTKSESTSHPLSNPWQHSLICSTLTTNFFTFHRNCTIHSELLSISVSANTLVKHIKSTIFNVFIVTSQYTTPLVYNYLVIQTHSCFT